MDRRDSGLHVEIHLLRPEPSTDGLTRDELWDLFGGYPRFEFGSRLKVSRTPLRAQWITQTPREACMLRIHGGPKASFEPIEVSILPRPNGEDTLTVQVP